MIQSDYAMPPDTPDETAREAEIVRSGVLFMASDARLTGVVAQARDGFDTDMAALTIVYADWQYVIAAVGMEPGVYRRSTSFCGHAILAPDRIFCVPDATLDDRFRGNPSVRGGLGVRFYAGGSLMSAGLPLGALCVFDPRPRPCLDDVAQRALEAMATQAMAILRDIVARRAPG